MSSLRKQTWFEWCGGRVWSMEPRRWWSARVIVVAALAVSGCGLFDDDAETERLLKDLELELTPVANGAEESARQNAGAWVLMQAFMADVLQQVDTDPDKWSPGVLAMAWRQARQLASNVEERLLGELDPSVAESHPLMAQVRWATGLAELYLGMTFCETYLDGEDLTDAQLYRMAELSLGQAIETSRRASSPEYLNAALAGRAQARMLLEDWDGAESDAMAVPAGFSYVSHHSDDDPNPLVLWIEVYRRAGFLHKWWPLVEESEGPGFLIDPWSGEKDHRIPAHYDGGTLAGSEIPRHQPRKYDSVEDDIPIVHYDLAQLIIAEARAERGDYAGATTVLNGLRAAVGLPPHDTPTSAEEMGELILWERFAELHLEGQRLIDLHRKGLMEEVFEELNDPERPGIGRRSKWGACGDG